MSLSRSDQARLNGAKSRGPKTQAGKERSAKNATKHNLSGKDLVILDTENDEAFQKLHQAFVDKFRPQDEIESECLLHAAVARWRLRRIWKLETSLFNVRMLEQESDLRQEWTGLTDVARQGAAYRSQSDTLAKLNRYERSISREYERAMKAFDRARAERDYEPPVEAEEAPVEVAARAEEAASEIEVRQPETENRQNEPKRPTLPADPEPRTLPSNDPLGPTPVPKAA